MIRAASELSTSVNPHPERWASNKALPTYNGQPINTLDKIDNH
jgi:hypothetical protein